MRAIVLLRTFQGVDRDNVDKAGIESMRAASAGPGPQVLRRGPLIG
jgi:hypothetical protein